MARPRALTPEVIEAVVAIIGPGVRRKDAAMAAGVSAAAYFNWLARGNRERDRMAALGLDEPDPGEAIFVEFLDRTEHAWAEAKAAALVMVRQAMPDDWRAAAWWLERTYPTEYGLRRVQVDVAHTDGDESPLPEDTAEALAAAAERYLEEQAAGS